LRCLDLRIAGEVGGAIFAHDFAGVDHTPTPTLAEFDSELVK
jgi:hypothetical protein